MTQGDGATRPTVMEEDPFVEVLDTTNQAKDISCHEFAAVLRQNVKMAREVESIGCLLHTFRVHDVKVFWRTQESMELVLAQDVEMDCFGFEDSQ